MSGSEDVDAVVTARFFVFGVFDAPDFATQIQVPNASRAPMNTRHNGHSVSGAAADKIHHNLTAIR